MKKILTLIILSMPILCLAQSQVQGEWKLSPVKLLRLAEDHSFHLTKGAYHHYGSYEVVDTESKEILRLHFETVSIDYEILMYSDTKMELLDTRNNDILTARKVNSGTQAPVVTDVEEDVVEKQKPEVNPFLKNHYRNLYPDNQFYFALGGGGGLSWASGETTASKTEEIGNVTEDFSTSNILSYGGGFKLGYQLSDGFYLGSGASYLVSGFTAERKASTSDPEYQFDAESSQKAKFTYSSIEIPIWANYRLADKWMFEAGGIFSLPLRSSSKAVFEGNNSVWINGELDTNTSYTSDEYTLEYPNVLEDYAIGGYAEIQRRLAKHLIFSLSYRHVKDYMQFDSAPISNNMVYANLSFQLF